MSTNIGVEVTTSLRSGPSNPGVPAGAFHIAGLTERGPVGGAVSLRSLAEFVSVFGGRTPWSSNVYDTARLFWEEGGSQLFVNRVVGPDATTGELSLEDTAAVPTLRIVSVQPGAGSTGTTVTVTTGASTYTVAVAVDGETVATYANLTSPADLVAAVKGSPYIDAFDLGSITATPGNNPAAVEATPLSAGTDDRAAVNATVIIDAFNTAGTVAAGGCVSAPGYTADVIGEGLLAHAAQHKKIALLTADADATVAEVSTLAQTLAGAENGDHGGIFYPHMLIPDGSGTRVIGPEGYVAAVRSRAFTTEGFWQVPAGDRARTRWASGTNVNVDVSTNNTLSAAGVNGIVTTAGKTRLYNWRSLSADQANLGMLSARDTLNNVSLLVAAALEQYVFGTLDGKGWLLFKIKSAVTGVLSPISRRGGFFSRLDASGEEVDPGYSVTVDATNNPSEAAAGNQVNVSTAIRLSPTAALIKVEIVKVPVTANV